MVLIIHPFINTHKAAVIIKYTQYKTTENIQNKHKNKSSNKSSTNSTYSTYNQWMNWPYGRSHRLLKYNYTVVQKNAPTLADYNYNPVESILIIFRELFVNDHKSCLVVKFSTPSHICCHYTLWNTMLYFSLIVLLIAKNAPTLDDHNFNKR